MSHKTKRNTIHMLTVLIGLLILSACQFSTPTPAVPPAIPTLPPTVMIEPTLPVVPTATTPVDATVPATLPPTATLVPAPTSEPPAPSMPAYLDDRSTATGLMDSFFNALNRSEYLRAYSYWRDPAVQLGNFQSFADGYKTTANTKITYGQIGGDAGAGQMYYSVPLILTVTNSDASIQRYAACYILKLSQPGVQATPPFQPLGIDRGKAVELAADANQNSALASACSVPDFPVGAPLSETPLTNHEDYSSDNYLDERSDPSLVLRSFYNALNRHEYLRAYSYWKDASAALGTFTNFEAQYQNLSSVEFVAGESVEDAGAGQRHYLVPVVARLTWKDSTVQTLQGCYTLHISLPGIQATPPFNPLGIRESNLTAADNTTALVDILSTVVCGP